jgi:hypothetical protein
MAAAVITTASTMLCAHGGSVSIVPTSTRVKAGGNPVLVQGDALTVAGCPFTVPPGVPTPCVAAQVLVASQRVKVGGRGIVTTQGVVMTTGSGPPVPVTATVTQTRAKAS